MIVGFHLVKGITACSTGETVVGDDRKKHLELLLKFQYPEHLCVFWHMEMSWSVIIGNIFRLKKEQAEILLKEGELKGNNFALKYIPDKFASIRNGSRFKSPLTLFSNMGQFIDCVFTENPTVDECLKNARDAAEYGEKAVATSKKLDIDATVLTSPIRIFEKVYIGKYDDRGNPKPKGIDLPTTLVNDSWVNSGEDYAEEFKRDIAHLAYGCVHGGWVECFHKGHFPNSADYDVVSAYSNKLANLLDFRQGTFIKTPEYQPKADYGFCLVDLKMTASFHPILYNTDVENHFTPIGYYEDYEIQKSELDIIDEFKLGTYEIKKGYWWMCKRPYKPLFYIVNWLQQLKKEYEGFDRDFVKRTLNGLWGMLLQIKRERQPDGTMKQIFGEHFNSIWGSIAECEARLDDFRFAMKALKENRKVIYIVVDGVTTDEPVSFVDHSKEKQPGEWRLEANCPSLVISSGCVAIQDKMGKGEFGMDYNWLVSEINKKPKATEYPETKLSPMTLAKCINLGQYDRIGEVEEITKTIDIHAEMKRQYPKEPKNGGELLKGQFESIPLDMGMIHNMNLFKSEVND